MVQAGQRVRISAQLVRGTTARNLWAESFEGDLRDVLSLQKGVARSIVEKIRTKLKPEEERRLAAARKVDPQAYQAYLKGRFTFNLFTEKGIRQSLALFQKAIELDPTYAPACARAGDAYWGLSSVYMAPNEAMPRARAAALKALELDPSLAEAHTILALVKTAYEWDWTGAEREFLLSLGMRPHAALARFFYSYHLVLRGRFDEAIAQARQAIELDPISPWLSASQGWQLYAARRYSDAERQLRKVIELSPDDYLAYVFLGLVLAQRQDYGAAISLLEKAMSMNRNPDGLAQLGYVYGRAGRRQDARRIISELEGRKKRGFVPAVDFAMVYAGLDEKDEAFRWLERAVEDHSEMLTWLGVEPAFDGLRTDPRMKGLLRRLGLEKLAGPPPASASAAPNTPPSTAAGDRTRRG